MTDPATLSATAAAAQIRAGVLSVETLARACLARIAARDPVVKAWSYVDPAAVLRQAREMDKQPATGRLHGIPIGVKDVIDTADMPTQHNSPLYAGHRPNVDAAVIATLRAEGALILGKTDTTEFAAAGRVAASRHPLDPRRTPGGSSSGSAAAVADWQVPLALGTQTAGSTIRPASFCGIFGMKPTWGAVGREGLKVYSVSLDTIGFYARAIEDLALLCDVFDVQDDARAAPAGLAGLRIAVCRTPAWPAATPGTPEALAGGAEALRRAGAAVSELTLPAAFDGLGESQRQIMFAEGRAAFLNLARTHKAALHDEFHARVENRDGTTRRQLLDHYDHAADCRRQFDALAAPFDAVLTPSARGEAPVGTHPGDAVFNRMWTLLHVPCVNVPAFSGPDGMPVGLTLCGPRFTDRHVLATAALLAPLFADHAAAGRVISA